MNLSAGCRRATQKRSITIAAGMLRWQPVEVGHRLGSVPAGLEEITGAPQVHKVYAGGRGFPQPEGRAEAQDAEQRGVSVEEYANIRLTLVWSRAARLPRSSSPPPERHDQPQSAWNFGKPT
jgi:hypothetical protein